MLRAKFGFFEFFWQFFVRKTEKDDPDTDAHQLIVRNIALEIRKN